VNKKEASERRCPATTGRTRRINDRENFPCELPDDGHEWHKRHSPPLAARWRDKPGGGRMFAWARTQASSPAEDC
jgi:hypothetical protein